LTDFRPRLTAPPNQNTNAGILERPVFLGVVGGGAEYAASDEPCFRFNERIKSHTIPPLMNTKINHPNPNRLITPSTSHGMIEAFAITERNSTHRFFKNRPTHTGNTLHGRNASNVAHITVQIALTRSL